MPDELVARFRNPRAPYGHRGVQRSDGDRRDPWLLRGWHPVREDIALIGFHDIPTARYTTPALTTIGHPLIELGEMAAESLFVLLGGGEVAERDRTVPVSLVVRESCGAALTPAVVITPTMSPPTATAQRSRIRPHELSGGAPCVSTFCVG